MARSPAELVGRGHLRLTWLRAQLGSILGQAAPLGAILQDAAAALLAHLEVAFLRIWTLDDAEGVLVLRASAGLYIHVDGLHARIPVGQWKIGRIATRRAPHLTNDVLNDPEISDVDWARREGMVAFAGYPLLVEERLVGVVATFARHALDAVVLQELGAVADGLAQCVERKRAEAALRASEQRLRMMVDNAQHGLWDWEIATGREDLDDRWYAILGYAPCEVPPSYRVWEDSIHAEDKAPVLAALQAHLAARTSLFDVDYRARTRQGDWVWVNTRGRVYERAPDGRPLRMMGTIHDITARKHAEAERARFEAQLQHTQKLESLGVLTGGIAHDFNNLLMAILGSATLALDDLPDGSPAIPRLRVVEQAAQRAVELTQQMLAYAGKAPLVRTVVSVDGLVQEMHTLLATVVSKKAAVQLQLEPAAVEGDPSQIRQVIMNLITNASEALVDSAGTIRISTGVRHLAAVDLRSSFVPEELPEGRYAVIDVEDTGQGIGADTLPRIFDPFFTTKFTGRGLGLAAVLGIVRSHHGTIIVTSATDGGSTFRVCLPEAATESRATSGARPVVSVRAHGTVLVIDDEELVRDYVKSALESAGYGVLLAADGREGLTVYETHREDIAVVLLDLTMPNMDGVQVVEALRQQGAEVPVLVMSGYAMDTVAARFSAMKATSCVQKPIGVVDLVARVQQLMATATQRGEQD